MTGPQHTSSSPARPLRALSHSPSPNRTADSWRTLMLVRFAAFAAMGVACLFPFVGPYHFQLAFFLLVLSVPYNLLWYWLAARRGAMTPAMSYCDTLLIVGLLIVVPEQSAPVLLFLLAMVASTAIAFGTAQAVGVCAVTIAAASAVAVVQPFPNAFAMIATTAVLGFSMAFVIGSVSHHEQEVSDRYADLVGGIDAIVWEQLTQRPSTLLVNDEAVHMLGYPAEDWRQPGMWRKVVHPDDLREARLAYRDTIRRGESREIEYRMLAADGSVVHVLDRVRVETDDLGRAVRVKGVMLDVTETRQAEQKANQFVNLVDGIKLALFVFGLPDRDEDALTLLAINPEAARLVNVDPDRAIGQRYEDVISLPADEILVGSLADVVRTGEGFTIDEFRPSPEGRGGRVYTAHAFPLPGDAVGLSLHDITERTMAAEVLRRQALHDGLTGLPNRTLLNERVRSAIARAEATGGHVALLVMDLDQFKDVNDALGHDSGDRLLIETSRRLTRVLRDVDTIARLGGDEYAVLVDSAADVEGATETALAIRHALEQPMQLGGISIQTNASIGIAVYPDHAPDAETLVQRADVAMYAAKRKGGGSFSVYAPEHDQSSVHRLALLGDLRNAVQHDAELVLFYQPALDLATGTVRAAEALVRWQHPERGMLPPGEFIEIAEVSGLIQPLTRKIIDQALDQVGRWGDAGMDITVSVNLSVRNLHDRDLVPWVRTRIGANGVDPAKVKFEITESELMDDPLLALEVLGRLKDLGAATSIDDFGTGYSSLAYLKHLPVDELKIDKSFVDNLIEDRSDLTIVRSTIDLSHDLGLSVVAEGVEDGPTLRRLAELGCDRAQGYFVSRPVPADELTAWLQQPDALAQVRDHLLTPSGG